MYKWDIYEISTKETPIRGVKFRGRLRKYAVLNHINLLTENASDKDNVVRFAVENNFDIRDIAAFLKSLANDADVTLVERSIVNPVLSKMKVNIEERYSI